MVLHARMDAGSCYKLEEFTFLDGWIARPEADTYLQRCLTEIPWAPKKWNVFYTLPQLAFYYDITEREKRPLAVLEELVSKVEEQFQTQASVVWCNLFRNGSHYMDWHQDQYGEHLFVLSFGGTRLVQFRHKKTKQVQEYSCKHGDLYYFSPQWDKVYEHRIPKDESIKEQRISFAIFTQPPGVSRK